MNRQMDASFAWDDLKALRDAWPHTLLVKGLLRAEDAEHCIQLAVDGLSSPITALASWRMSQRR